MYMEKFDSNRIIDIVASSKNIRNGARKKKYPKMIL